MQEFIPKTQARGLIVPNFIQQANLSLGARYLFGFLCDYAREKNYCWPSKKTMSDKIQCSLNSIRNWLKELIAKGFVKTHFDGRKEIFYLYCPAEIAQNTKKNFSRECLNFEQDRSNFECKTNLNKINTLTPSSPPKDSHSQTPPNKKSFGSVDFESFWSAYPKKENKEKAKKSFYKALKYKSLPLLEQFVNALNYFKSSSQWQRDEGRYIPQLHNFMNDKRWQDVPAPQTPKEVVKPVDFEAERRRIEKERLERQKNEESHQMLQSAWEEFSGNFKPDMSREHRFTSQRAFFKHCREKNAILHVTSYQNMTIYEYFIKNQIITR